VSRLGGDEFTILAIDVRPGDVSIIIDRINAATGESNAERADNASEAWHLGISLGVAHFEPDAPEQITALLRTADAAHYEQKRQRKAKRAQAA
jgi:diguanylate cyclase (GGDEF)-like protein